MGISRPMSFPAVGISGTRSFPGGMNRIGVGTPQSHVISRGGYLWYQVDGYVQMGGGGSIPSKDGDTLPPCWNGFL